MQRVKETSFDISLISNHFCKYGKATKLNDVTHSKEPLATFFQFL